MRESWSPPKVHLNILSSNGGMGDLIARIPAIKYMLEASPHTSTTVYWQDYFVELARYLLPEHERLKHGAIGDAKWNMARPIIEFDMERLTTLQLHLTDHAFLILMDQMPPDDESRFYPAAPVVVRAGLNYMMKDAGLATAPYIVFTIGYTSNTRRWPAAHINTLAKRVRQHGLTPVLLGTTKKLNVGLEGDYIKAGVDEDIDRSLFVDLVDRTSLIECLGIIQRARAVVGVDNGLLHLAHCTDVPVVAGFTSLDPKHRVPYRRWPGGRAGDWSVHGLTKVITASTPCINGKPHCQSEGFAINQDWRSCIFGDYACTLEMSSSQFETALKKLNVLP